MLQLQACAKGKDKKKEATLVNDLLMPVAKSLTANWNDGNRREAAIVLAHIIGSGREASQTVQAMIRMLKKVNSVRFLEAQMISLRLAFEKWLNSEPEELESDRPTEEEMDKYEEAEIRHQEMVSAVRTVILLCHNILIQPLLYSFSLLNNSLLDSPCLWALGNLAIRSLLAR